MKKLWILIIAGLMMIPATAMVSSANEMEHQTGCYVGHFNYSSGSVQGEFVSFNINPESGEIQNYEVNGTMIFESVTYQNDTTGNVWVKGASLFYYGQGATLNISNFEHPKMNFMWRFLHAHDNPAGVLHIVVYGGDVITYKLASGLNAEPMGKHMVIINGSASGVMIFTGTASVSGDEIKVTLGNLNYTFGKYVFHGGSVVFIRTDDWQIPSRVKEKIINGIKEGKVAGQIDVSGKGTTDFVNYTYDFHASVQMKKNGMSVFVSSENHTGKVVVINVDKSKLQYDSHHKIVVKVDGREAKMTTDTDVLAGGTENKYVVINGTGEVTILVYVSHFSSHTIDIESQSTGASSTGTINVVKWMENPLVIVAIVAVIAVVAAIIIKRR